MQLKRSRGIRKTTAQAKCSPPRYRCLGLFVKSQLYLKTLGSTSQYNRYTSILVTIQLPKAMKHYLFSTLCTVAG